MESELETRQEILKQINTEDCPESDFVVQDSSDTFGSPILKKCTGCTQDECSPTELHDALEGNILEGNENFECCPVNPNPPTEQSDTQPSQGQWIVVSEEPLFAITTNPNDDNMMFSNPDETKQVTNITPLEAPVLNKLQFVPVQKQTQQTEQPTSQQTTEEPQEPEFFSERLIAASPEPVVGGNSHDRFVISQVKKEMSIIQGADEENPLAELPQFSTKDLVNLIRPIPKTPGLFPQSVNQTTTQSSPSSNPATTNNDIVYQPVYTETYTRPEKNINDTPKKPVSIGYKIDRKYVEKMQKEVEQPTTSLPANQEKICPLGHGRSLSSGSTCPLSDRDRNLLKFTLENFGIDECERLARQLEISGQTTKPTVENRFHFNKNDSPRTIVNNFYF
jgi:hypothetical protein